MIFQFFNKITLIATFYSLITLLLCGLSSGRLTFQAGLSSLIPCLQAITGLLGSYLILAIAKMVVPVAVFKLPFFFGLPTICAVLYWSYGSKTVRMGLAAVCMMLFITHPIGFYAAPYALFWLIPLVIALLPQHHLLTAFGSTFTAHAAGSVMYLYILNDLSADAWIALMPLVVIERTILALSAWMGYLLAHKICNAYKAAYLRYVCQ